MRSAPCDNAAMKRIAILGIVLVLALGAGLLAAHFSRSLTQAPEIGGVVFDPPRSVPEFQLVRADGEAFTRNDLAGQWNLLFFGYTHCPDVCPTTLSMLDRVSRELGAAAPEVDFITLDPMRDTPDALHEYLDAFNPRFVGITGAQSAIDAFAQGMGIAYEYSPGKQAGSYEVTHSAALLLVDPQGHVAALFTPPFHARHLIRDLRAVQNYHGA